MCVSHACPNSACILRAVGVVKLTPAAATARLAKVCKMAHERLLAPDIAHWCAASRKRLLARRAVAGDLPLGDTVEWTLERLHLCEHPPRFPHVFFRFASDLIEASSGPSSEIAAVARLLRTHPKLRLRIHGYAHPEAPSFIGEALAQARATSVRHELLRLLADMPEFADEDPEEGVRAEREQSPWSAGIRTQLVGERIQALGRWGFSPTNVNYTAARTAAAREEEEADEGADDEEEADFLELVALSDPASSEGAADSDDDDAAVSSADDDEDDDEDDDDFGGHDKLRRAEFTLLKLER